MKTIVEKITPKIAEEYLKKVKAGNQRKLIMSRAESYAREMRAGHWFLNHQGIAFDENDCLIDGQHRLMAIILSGIAICLLVTRGIAAEMVNGVRLYAIDTIDNGYKRQTGEQLALRHGVENANRVAAATRAVLLWATGIPKNTTSVALEILSIYPSIKKLSSGNKSKTLPGSVVGCFAVALRAFPELFDSFVDPYITGANLKKGSPALLLRNLILNTPIGGGSATYRCINQCFYALKAAALHEDIKTVRNNESGSRFFAQNQKGIVRKIREAAGLTETTTQEEQ
ncbi:MAG: hypothetical protein EBT75_09065 [Proteobacteria bacterium]|nr:hypothetical protein [Pseudomonadota bacterium]NBS50799.1 hypothetical protein [Verrucomicrobiota bacterium]